MEEYIGSILSVDCGPGRLYQGKLTAVDANTKNITIANAFKEGVPLGKCVTIPSKEIKALKVFESHSRPNASSSSSPQVTTRQKIPNTQKITPKPKSSANAQRVQKEAALQRTPEQDSIEKLFETKLLLNISGSDKKGTDHRLKDSKMTQTPEKQRTMEISSTPLFQMFEPQVPHPTELSKIGGKSSSKGCNKRQGPSGIPLLDALNCYQGRKANGRNNFDLPSDFDLNSDFDFAENLKLFEKDDVDDEYYENVEKHKVSKNFAHYENIVDDEMRVISWTKVKSANSKGSHPDESNNETNKSKSTFLLNSISFEKSGDGQPIPAVTSLQKSEFIKECSEALSEAVLDTVLADRLFSWICDVQERFGDNEGTIVLIASAANSVRYIRRILTHLDKRAFNCHLFGKYPGEKFENVNVVNNIRDLPNSPIICILSQEVNEYVETWLKTQTNSHFVCIENVPQFLAPENIHLLMYGCATAGVRHVPKKLTTGRTCFEQLCEATPSNFAVDSAIADVGCPSNWFDDYSKQFIASAFATSFLVRLSSS